MLRRLVDAGTRIVQLGYGQGDGDVETSSTTPRPRSTQSPTRGGEDYVLGDVIEATVDEIEAPRATRRR